MKPTLSATCLCAALVGCTAGDLDEGRFGTTRSGLSAIPPFTDTFETGMLDPCWTTASNNEGRIQVSTANAPNNGTYHVLMDDMTDLSLYSRNELTLSLNLTGASNLTVRFWAKDFGDEAHPLPLTFTGSADGDGVAISDDGTNWYRALDLGAVVTATYQQYDIDLDAVTAAAGMTYGPNFLVRFVQYDDYPITTDGIAIDDVQVGSDFNGTVVIDGGAATTGIATVTLTVTGTDPGGSGITDMSFSNDGLTWSPWEAFNTTRAAWDLTNPTYGGNASVGTKTVHARLADGAGNSSLSFTDTITYSPPPTPAAFPFSETFESGMLVPSWRTTSTNVGRIRVSTLEGPPAGGSYHLLMDGTPGFTTYSGNELDLAINLTGQTGVFLAFYARDYQDEPHPLPLTFTGSANGDGVAISEDGNTWHRVVDFGPLLTSVYQEVVVDLDAAVAAAGISYNSSFMIRFVQYDNYEITTDGIGIDEVQVLTPPPDTFPPTGSILIEGGASSTQYLVVDLTPSATDTGFSGLADMRFSNDGSTWSTWEPYATARALWDLSAFGGTTASGTKTVYAQYRDTALNVSTSYTDTITFTPPATICDAPPTAASIGTTDTQTGSLTTADAQYAWDSYPNRYVDAYEMVVGGNGSVTVALDSIAFDTVVYVYNTSGCAFVGRDLDSGTGTNSLLTFTVAPGTYRIVVTTTSGSATGSYTVSTTGSIVDSTPPTGTVSINGGAASTPSLVVNLSLSASDIGGSGLADMSFSNNGSTWSSWELYSVTKSGWDLSLFGGSTLVGNKTVYARFRDGAGNISMSSTDTINYAPPMPASFPFSDDFESGSLGPWWSTVSTGNGRILVTTANTPRGSYHAAMDSSVSLSYALNELVLTINLATASSVRFRFYAKDFADEPEVLPVSFTGSVNGDGVSISADGNTWYRVWDAATLITGTYQQVDIDLDAAATTAGISYNGTFQIKFQQYDDYPIATDGITFDDVELVVGVGDSTPPTGTISINSGAASTSSFLVTLDLTASDTGGSGLADMSFSNDGALWSPWESYAASKPTWDLSATAYGGDSTTGIKTTYVRYRDGAGNVSLSYSDTITYNSSDSTPPTGSISINSGAATTTNPLVALSLSASDTGGSGLAEMQFSNDGITWSPWESYATLKSNWDVTNATYGGTGSSGTKTVYARYRDGALNESIDYSDTISYAPSDTIPPTGGIMINSGAVSTASLVVTLNLTAMDTGGTGVADMQFSNDGSAWSAWELFANTKSNWDLSDSTFGGNATPGSKNAFARYRDGAGNVSADYSTSILFMSSDTTPPTAPSNLIATAVSSSRIDLSWTAATDNVAILVYSLERSLDGIVYAAIDTTANTTYQDLGVAANSTYWYRVRATDTSANDGPFSNVATAMTPPAGVDAGFIEDGSLPSDGGTQTDGAVGADGAVTTDAGPRPDGSIRRISDTRDRDTGCSCNATPEREGGGLLLTILIGLAIFLRRRR